MVIKLRQLGSAELVQAVHDGSVDVALTASQHGSAPRGIEMRQLLSEAMVFVCRPDHPLSRRSSVAVPDLRKEAILRPPPGWGTRAIIDAAFGATQSAFEIANYSLMARLVREGFATTLAPESAISGDMLNELCAVPVDDAQLRWTLSTAVCTNRRMTAAATALLRALTQRSQVSAALVPAVATALPLVADGVDDARSATTPAEIAAALSITAGTAKTHVARLLAVVGPRRVPV